MRRRDLAERLARRTSMGAEECQELIEALTELISQRLLECGELTIRGFGKFTLRGPKPRTYFDPHSGRHLETRGNPRVTFHPSRALKMAVSEEETA